MKSLLIEGRYDALTNRIVRELLNVIKDSYSAVQDPDGLFLGHKVHYTRNESVPSIMSDAAPEVYSEEIENSSIPLEFYVSMKIQWIDGYDSYESDGNAYNDLGIDSDEPPLVEVLVKIDPKLYPSVLNKLIPELTDTVRHELEHLTQSGWNTKNGKYLPSDMIMRKQIESGKTPSFNYYLLDKEIPAMLHGLYNKAKKSKRPFADVVNDQMQQLIKLGWATPDQTEIIKAKWKTYLPKLAIRQEI
jgi:hypothetical protein